MADQGLDSKAVISVHEYKPGVFTLCVRQDYMENLGMYAFRRLANTFKEPRFALAYVKANYPRAVIVAFDHLTSP